MSGTGTRACVIDAVGLSSSNEKSRCMGFIKSGSEMGSRAATLGSERVHRYIMLDEAQKLRKFVERT
jgi:hypothetical protein